VSFRVDFHESVGDSLRRVAGERLDDAIEQLDAEFARDPEAAVHEARKDAKKARALLRLYRGELDRATYRRENQTLRDAARELSALRDADVLRDTVEDLGDRYVGQRPTTWFAALRDRVGDAQANGKRPEPAVAAARDRLTTARGRVDDWAVDGTDHSSLVDGLTRSYARGRKALARAERAPTDQRLHDWRKRVKDLRYQQQLLRPAFPDVLSAQAKAAKALAELLGDDHDLAVLDARLREHPPAEVADARELVAHRRDELQDEALRLGRRVYAESPKRFRQRIGRYLQAGRRDSRAAATT
jgi:CHAD domain-containing protein